MNFWILFEIVDYRPAFHILLTTEKIPFDFKAAAKTAETPGSHDSVSGKNKGKRIPAHCLPNGPCPSWLTHHVRYFPIASCFPERDGGNGPECPPLKRRTRYVELKLAFGSSVHQDRLYPLYDERVGMHIGRQRVPREAFPEKVNKIFLKIQTESDAQDPLSCGGQIDMKPVHGHSPAVDFAYFFPCHVFLLSRVSLTDCRFLDLSLAQRGAMSREGGGSPVRR